MTQDYRLTITGLNDDLVSFSAEVAIDVANDDSPWVSVQQWTVANPQLSGRERTTFLEQTAAENGWTLRPGSRRPTGGGVLVAAAGPADWELVLAAATQTAAHYRRVETAWHALIAASPLSVVQIADIAGFGRHRIYQIQNQINGPRGRRRATKPS